MMTQFGYGSRCERGASVEERLVCPAALRCNRGASSGVRAFVLDADARSDTDVYGARSVAMAGSACAQEEHRSERRPNGRTSARGGALSEWSRGRRGFANASSATVQVPCRVSWTHRSRCVQPESEVLPQCKLSAEEEAERVFSYFVQGRIAW